MLTRLALDQPTELRALADPGGKPMGPDERAQLLREVHAGNAPARLIVTATVFRQTPAPNRNYVRFKRGMLRAFARSFVGVPFMRDHEKGDFLAQGGRVLYSDLVEGKDDDVEIVQTLQLVKPWAIEAALDETLRTFSIAWHPREPAQCTACKAPMFSLGCTHFPGDVVGEGDKAQTVELLYTAADGIETSGVAVPAVLGTGIEEIRAALAAHRGGVRPPKEIPMSRFKVLAERLGVSEDAEEPTFLEAVERRAADLSRLSALYATEQAAHVATRARATELENQLAEVKRSENAAALAQLIDACRRKVGVKLGADNKPVDGGTSPESVLLSLAKHDMGAAKRFVEELAQVLPIGHGAASKNEPPTREQEQAQVSDQRRKLGRTLGLSAEDYAKFAPKPVQREEG